MAVSRPLRALSVLLCVWVAGRAIILMLCSSVDIAGGAALPKRLEWRANVLAQPPVVASFAPAHIFAPRRAERQARQHARQKDTHSDSVFVHNTLIAPDTMTRAKLPYAITPNAIGLERSLLMAGHGQLIHRASRLSLSGWALVRGAGDVTPALGQLGGSQVGVRGYYALDDAHHFSLTARVSVPLRSAIGKEAALGIALRPIAALPVQIIAERRIALDSGGRNDFELMVVGGIYDRRIGHALSVSGYAEAGVVGFARRGMFIDGAVEVTHPIMTKRDAKAELGIAAWGATQAGAGQAGVSRLDVGPEATLHERFGAVNMKLSASYRFEVLGNAAPSSGPALSLGTDF